MCGIVGIFSPYIATSPDQIRNMNSAIVRRGPDGEGYYQDDTIALGMRRLAIIDIDHGWQPIYNEDKTVVVVFNGEIYNHKEIRSDLQSKGHVFRTDSDTEVLVHLYEEFGSEMMKPLRGMFAFCVWDIKNKKGLICRDRFGIKPLFFAKTESGALYFASEIKSILATNAIRKEISPQAVDAYISYNYIPAPLTIYKNISKLMPGHFLELSPDGESSPRKYWEANSTLSGSEETDDEIESEIIHSAELHMISDVPVASFLSGGVDSSLVTALASKHKNFCGAYTAGFKTSTSLYDERPIAEEVARSYKIDNHKKLEIEPNPKLVLASAAQAFDEPFADDSIFPTWEICKAASRDVKVALTGLGGDELFGGYYRYHGIKLHQTYGKLPIAIRKLILYVAEKIFVKSQKRSINHALRFLRAGTLSSAEAYASYLTAIPEKERKQLIDYSLQKKIDFEYTKQLITQHFNRCTEPSAVKRAIYTDIHTYVPEDILALSDRVSMWHSLELRVPLMDHVLFEKCFSMSEKRILTTTEKKATLRRIARKYLPSAIFQQKKQGFESPMAEWINHELGQYIDDQLSESALSKSKIFNADVVSKLLRDHRNGITDNSKIIFSLLSFQTWYQEVFLK
jgi:asparagine synthase (glutamine-hydrolysing)